MASALDEQCSVRRVGQLIGLDDSDARIRSNNKRMRLHKTDYSQFQPGCLVKMRLENFVTYTLTEFDLSPSLNMIVGPNGSGKSTFVCAVCLGLAGKPEYIGRSKKVVDFIKNGEDKGSIEITLRNSPVVQDIAGVDSDDEVVVIKRLLTRFKSRSEYFINGGEVSESVIKLLMSQLNIQLDNLCQFLSQERVEEFARLKQEKLLVETIRSIDTGLLDTFNRLKQLQEIELNMEKELEINRQRLSELNGTREKLDQSVRAFKEYERKKREIEVHTQLLPYVKVKNHKEKSLEHRREYEEAKSNLKALLKKKKPFHNAKKDIEFNCDSIDDKVTKFLRDLATAKEKYRDSVEKLESIRDGIDKKRSQNKYYRDRTTILKTEIDKVKSNLEACHAQLATMDVPDTSKISEISSQRSDLIKKEAQIRDLILEVDSKKGATSHERSTLQRQIDVKQRSLHTSDRIGILDQSRDLLEVKKAVLYIRSRPEMAGKILEPPIMSVSVSNSKIAAYLAQCVDYNTCKAFTIIDNEAYEKYADEILQRFKVNLRELSNYEMTPPVPTEKIQSLGFEDYLSHFVTGNRHVIQMLCQFSKIHTIPISRRELRPEQLNMLTEPDNRGRLLFKRMIHGNKIVDIKRSLYGRNQVFMVDSNVRETKFYQASVISEEHKQRIIADITELTARVKDRNDIMTSLTAERDAHKQELAANQAKVDLLANEARSLNSARQKYSLKKNEIGKLESDIEQLKGKLRKDVSHKIVAVENEIAELENREIGGLQQMVLLVENLKKCQEEHLTSRIRYFEAQNALLTVKDVINHFAQQEEELTNKYNEKKQIIRDMRNTPEYKEWISQINSYSDTTKEELNEYAEEYERNDSFNLQFIQSMVDRLESEIAMENHDESAITILGQVEGELKQLESTLPRQVEKLNKTKDDIKRSLILLEPKLDEIASKISAKFSSLFSNVGSAGAVELEKPHMFSDWRIEIMVKFRDNAVLKKLDSHTQSGGERAVSTVLYMIALQEFISAPFRVVDEINQGMDSRNERIVHRSMVENACAENTSQYFLITPKLLSDLYYHEKMRVHCVMAGPWIPDPVDRPEMAHLGESSRYII